MDYQKMRVFSYDNYNLIEDEYKKRIESPATILTDLVIAPYSIQRGIRTTDKFPLFCVLLPSIMKKNEEITLNSLEINRLIKDIPGLAVSNLIVTQIINEIQSTNEIEGVQSTRKEISNAMSTTIENARFKGIANMYNTIISGEIIEINQLEDIRKLYDNLVLEEISEKDVPDGKLFRKEKVYVTSNDKNVHQGNLDEAAINRDLQKLIVFMNDSDLPKIIKAIITHYFFEYIHPFYDGNGRMGRFLLSSYLGIKLDELTGISFSQSVFQNKKLYEDAFAEVSHPKNLGEITHFVEDMMDIIIFGQETMIENIEIAVKKLGNARNYLYSKELTDNELIILGFMIEYYLFSPHNYPVSNKKIELGIPKQLSRYKIDNIMEDLEEKDYIQKIKDRPIVYNLSDRILEILE